MTEFVHEGQSEIAGRIYRPFSESFTIDAGGGRIVQSGLRTRTGVLGLQLYNQRLPRNSDYGNDKTFVQCAGGTHIEPIRLRDKAYLTIGW